MKEIKNLKAPSVASFNRKMQKELKFLITEYEGNIADINYRIATEYLHSIVVKMGAVPMEVEFANQSKNPINHFQLRVYLDKYIIWTNPFVYVDDKHKVVAERTNIEILNYDYDTIKTLEIS